MAPELTPVDEATHPFLSGRFAPVHDELDADQLEVEGTLPAELVGHYLRNGPNPMFPPLGSYTYPLEGDGMLHGLWLEGGTARYRNRFVRTQGLEAEIRAGKALYGGLMSPAMVDMSLLGDDPDPGWPFKLDAFVHVVRHAGRYLALEECTPAYEVTEQLETIGRFDFDGGLPDGLCAHPKVDTTTGEMFVFRYDVEAPFLTWAAIAADGTVTQPATEVAGVDEGYMVHDCALTQRYLVLVIGPLQFDLTAMFSGGQPLAWKPELGTRIALVPRDGSGPARWVETDAFWAWHYANAFDDGDQVVLDFPGYDAPGIFLTAEERRKVTAGFSRATIDPAAGTIAVERLDALGTEFPRIDDRRIGRRHRYLTVAEHSGAPGLRLGEHDVLRQYDMQTGTSTSFDSGAALGEAVFAPRPGGTDERDGWYLSIGTGLADDRSALYIIDAADVPAGPVATVALPQRVPNGLHGSWFPALP